MLGVSANGAAQLAVRARSRPARAVPAGAPARRHRRGLPLHRRAPRRLRRRRRCRTRCRHRSISISAGCAECREPQERTRGRRLDPAQGRIPVPLALGRSHAREVEVRSAPSPRSSARLARRRRLVRAVVPRRGLGPAARARHHRRHAGPAVAGLQPLGAVAAGTPQPRRRDAGGPGILGTSADRRRQHRDDRPGRRAAGRCASAIVGGHTAGHRAGLRRQARASHYPRPPPPPTPAASPVVQITVGAANSSATAGVGCRWRQLHRPCPRRSGPGLQPAGTGARARLLNIELNGMLGSTRSTCSSAS